MAGMLIWVGTLVWALAVVITWLVADEPTSRPFGKRLRDGTLIVLLRSPLGRHVGGMAVVTFHARRSGRTLATPVECVGDAGHLFVFVGQPNQKQWWRNVQADPRVTIDVRGRRVPGVATVHVGSDPSVAEDLASYIEHRPRVGSALGLPAKGRVDRAALARLAERVVSVRVELVPASAA